MKSLLHARGEPNDVEDDNSDEMSEETLEAPSKDKEELSEQVHPDEDAGGRVVFSGWLEKQRAGAAQFDHL